MDNPWTGVQVAARGHRPRRRLVEETNRELPSYARIKRFALLPAPLTEAAGELTPSLKIRRAVVARKYRELLESLYQ